MNIVLFGYGKMGKNIYRILKNNKNVQNVFVVDPAFTDQKIVPLQFRSFQDIPSDIKLDAAFVASNSVTHCDVLQQVLARGITNIFCEKPMCLTKKEYQTVSNILPSNARFVVDYILRSSQALAAFQNHMQTLKSQGYQLKSCNIDYGKDKTKDPRRFKDIGVYEELYHIWDLCFNGPLFGPIEDIRVLRNIYVPDPEIPGRCIQQRFKYQLKTPQNHPFIVNLNSSFRKDKLVRCFTCCLKKDDDQKVLSLSFDDQGEDRCMLIHSNLEEQTQSFPSNTKLDTIINDSLTYFKTGKKSPYFHGALDSEKFHNLMTQLKQVAPLHRELIQKRIQEMTH